MIKLKYTVASCVPDEFAASAEVGGRKLDVKVPGLVVEMESDDKSMGHTFKLVPDDLAATAAAFAVGTEVEVTLVPVLALKPEDRVQEDQV